MKLSEPILAIALLCDEANVITAQIQDAAVPSRTPIVGQIATKPDTSGVVYEPKASIDVRDYGVTGDGRTNDTTAVSALLTAIGSSPVRSGAQVPTVAAGGHWMSGLAAEATRNRTILCPVPCWSMAGC